MDNYGNDFLPGSTAYTLQACEYACYNLPQCMAFTYTGDGNAGAGF